MFQVFSLTPAQRQTTIYLTTTYTAQVPDPRMDRLKGETGIVRCCRATVTVIPTEARTPA